jgi:hypothetical protein
MICHPTEGGFIIIARQQRSEGAGKAASWAAG